jgi:hypothetical protein
VVEPLRVVDDARERLLLGDVGEQAKGRQPDQEPVGRSAFAPTEHRGKRVALRDRQTIEVIQHRDAQLMEGAVRELHLGLDTDSPYDMPARDTLA